MDEKINVNTDKLQNENIVISDFENDEKLAMQDYRLVVVSSGGDYSQEVFGLSREKLNDMYTKFISKYYQNKLDKDRIFDEIKNNMPVKVDFNANTVKYDSDKKDFELMTALEAGVTEINFANMAGLNSKQICESIKAMGCDEKVCIDDGSVFKDTELALVVAPDTIKLLFLKNADDKLLEDLEYMKSYVEKIDANEKILS